MLVNEGDAGSATELRAFEPGAEMHDPGLQMHPRTMILSVGAVLAVSSLIQ